jgi:hypothetical protein
MRCGIVDLISDFWKESFVTPCNMPRLAWGIKDNEKVLDSVPFPPRPLFLPQPPFVSHGLEYLFDFFLFLLVTFSGNFSCDKILIQ